MGGTWFGILSPLESIHPNNRTKVRISESCPHQSMPHKSVTQPINSDIEKRPTEMSHRENRSLSATVSVSAEENGRTRSQTKAREIKGKWDRMLLRGVIVQYISQAQECLLGMPRPYYSNMARNPIIEQTPAVKAAKRRTYYILGQKIVSSLVSKSRTKAGEKLSGCLKLKLHLM